MALKLKQNLRPFSLL